MIDVIDPTPERISELARAIAILAREGDGKVCLLSGSSNPYRSSPISDIRSYGELTVVDVGSVESIANIPLLEGETIMYYPNPYFKPDDLFKEVDQLKFLLNSVPFNDSSVIDVVGYIYLARRLKDQVDKLMEVAICLDSMRPNMTNTQLSGLSGLPVSSIERILKHTRPVSERESITPMDDPIKTPVPNTPVKVRTSLELRKELDPLYLLKRSNKTKGGKGG